MGADGTAHLAVFLVNRPGFGQQIGGDRIRRLRAAEIRGRLLHPLDRPKQVDGRGAAGGQEVGNFIQPGEPGGFVGAGRRLHADTHAVGGGDADRRSTTHAKHLYRFPNGLHVAAIDVDKLHRQPRLVDQPQMPVHLADPA